MPRQLKREEDAHAKVGRGEGAEGTEEREVVVPCGVRGLARVSRG